MSKKDTMINIIKGGLGLIGGFGIGIMAKEAGGLLTPENATRLTKLSCRIGASMIAFAVSGIASDRVNKSIDSIAESIRSVSDAMNGVVTEDDAEEIDAEIVG